MDYQVEFLHYYFRHSGAAQHRHFSRVDAFASRVAAIAECTAYEGVDPLSPFRVEVRHAVEEWRAGESADALRERAFAQLDTGRLRLVAS